MNVFIARDGAVIGEYPDVQLEYLLRNGQLGPDDDYWHEGMEEWGTLQNFLSPQTADPELPAGPSLELRPPSSNPLMDRRLLYSGVATLLGLTLLLGFWVIKPDAVEDRTIALESRARPNTLSATETRDLAAADLRRKIEDLPTNAKPPQNTFYYDVRVNMDRTLSLQAPWRAKIHGWENVVDPMTAETLTRTEFLLITDYENGEWIYKSYEAAVVHPGDGASQQIVDDENTPIPPSLVGALGLKRRGPSVMPPSMLSGGPAAVPPLLQTPRP